MAAELFLCWAAASRRACKLSAKLARRDRMSSSSEARSTCFSISCRRATEVSVWPDSSATVSVSMAIMDCLSSCCTRRYDVVRWQYISRASTALLARSSKAMADCGPSIWRASPFRVLRKDVRSVSFPPNHVGCHGVEQQARHLREGFEHVLVRPRGITALLQKAFDRDHGRAEERR